MEETDPFLNTNPFGELVDEDDDDPSNNSTASNPTPQQQPLTANELELEAIRAQQRALLQATSTLTANPAELFNNTALQVAVVTITVLPVALELPLTMAGGHCVK